MSNNRMRFLILALVLASCTDSGKDYAASAKCQGMGHKPGTAEYDKCVNDEKTAQAMQQQREEFERMRQYQQDQKLMNY
jgi:hypothetical protein